ncbi:MAG: large subunit ribosomal protein L1 [Planctomycetota bacterium]|jgi:large subunit ribosomal protein L1
MPKRSKRYRAAKARAPQEPESLETAIQTLSGFPKVKFDETVELCVRLGIDPKKSDQMVRGAISLPHGIGKTLRVICFAEGPKAEEAKNAGAVEVGSADLAQKIQDGWMDFDVAVATPDMMRHVGRLGKVLGPQGKMPSPKAGTVTMDVGTAVSEFVAGKIEFRVDAGGNIHAPVGKRSFEPVKLAENVKALLDYIVLVKPSAAKGHYMVKAVLTATHSPGVPIKL